MDGPLNSWSNISHLKSWNPWMRMNAPMRTRCSHSPHNVCQWPAHLNIFKEWSAHLSLGGHTHSNVFGLAVHLKIEWTAHFFEWFDQSEAKNVAEWAVHSKNVSEWAVYSKNVSEWVVHSKNVSEWTIHLWSIYGWGINTNKAERKSGIFLSSLCKGDFIMQMRSLRPRLLLPLLPLPWSVAFRCQSFAFISKT